MFKIKLFCGIFLEMKNSFKKALFTSIDYALFAIVIEMFVFVYFGWGIFPQYFVFDLALILFFALIIYILPYQWLRNAVTTLIIGFQIVISYANFCVYRNVSSVFCFDMFNLTGETAQVLEGNMFDLWSLAFFIPIIAIFVFSLVAITKLKEPQAERKKFNLRTQAFALSLLALVSVLGYSAEQGSVSAKTTSSESVIADASLHSTFYVATSSVKKFGTYGYYIEDMFRRLFNYEKSTISKEESMQQLLTEEYQPTQQILYNVCEGDDVVVIMAESFEWFMINEELTPVLYSLANGVDLSKLDVANGEYFYDFTPNEDGTYKFARTSLNYSDLTEQEVGLTLMNYHSKSQTDYAEHSVMLGSYPFKVSYTDTSKIYVDNDFGFTLPNMLNERGYETSYFHTWLRDFYRRGVVNKKYGFHELMFKEDMTKLEDYTSDLLGEGAKDSAFMQLYYDDFTHTDTDKPYLSFFTTVATHGPYDYDWTLEEYYPVVEQSDAWLRMPYDIGQDADLWNGYVTTELAGAVDTEMAVAYLIYNLILEGRFEDTVIVFYGDHNSYYNGEDKVYKNLYYDGTYEKIMGKPYHWAQVGQMSNSYGEFDPNRYCQPAFIYSTKITDEVLQNNSHYVTDFAQTFDLTVSILNLLGIDYLPGAYLGYPIYCQNEEGERLLNNAMISPSSGIFNGEIFSDDGNQIKYIQPGVTEEDVANFKLSAQKYFNKWQRMTGLYEYDLYRELREYI